MRFDARTFLPFFLLVGCGAEAAQDQTPDMQVDQVTVTDADVAITVKHTGQLLSVAGSAVTDGAQVVQFPSVGSGDQKWRLRKVTDGVYEIVNAKSGKCLDVAAGSMDDGGKVIQWTCGGGDNQRWQLKDMGDGYAEIVSVHSGKCLDVTGVSRDQGAPIQQWGCAASDNQRWKIGDGGATTGAGGKACVAGAAVGEGDDFFTSSFGKGRTFDERPEPLLPHDLNDVKVENGALSATIHPVDAQFFLQFPGVPSSLDLASGQAHPIDASRYRRLAVKLCTPANRSGQAVMMYLFDKDTGSAPAATKWLPVQQGCGVYVYDLPSVAAWKGTMRGIRFDLDGFGEGDAFSIDWFRLTAAPDPKNTVAITWKGLPASGDLELYLDADGAGADGFLVKKIPAAPATGSFAWGSDVGACTSHGAKDPCPVLPQDVQPGTYHVYAKVNGQTIYLPDTVTVKAMPLIRFTNPSRVSGRDYATDAGNPWDMDASGKDGHAGGVTSASFAEGHVDAHNTGNDPTFTFNTPTPIDTSLYRYLTVNMWSQYSFYDGKAGLLRLFYLNSYGDKINVSDDLLISAGQRWLTYTWDMTQIRSEDGQSNQPWTADRWKILRLDANEDTENIDWRWMVGEVKLTAPPLANRSFDVTWAVDGGAAAATKVSLFFDADSAGFDGTKIGDTTAAAGKLTWDTSALANGEYYVYACVDDCVNRRCSYSEAPVRVQH